MKKILLFLFVLLLSGCVKLKGPDVKEEFSRQFEKSSGYYLEGELVINNNDDVYHYDVEVYHKKDDYYHINLFNQDNQFRQILLKNPSGVYLYTPSLNKSFKFQSSWPNNHSQIYLLDAIVKDIQNDKDYTVEEKNESFILHTKVHYNNNSNLTKQKIVLDKNYMLKKVVVYDSSDQIIMEFTITNIKYSPKVDDDYFELDSIVGEEDSSDEDLGEEDVKETSVLEDVIYPLFIPSGTKLVEEEKVLKDNGERVIMTYDGEKSFLLVEETQDVFHELTIIPTSGEPFQLMDTIGVMTDNSLSWSSGGTDYYLVSDVMSQQELVEIAQSIVGIPSMK